MKKPTLKVQVMITVMLFTLTGSAMMINHREQMMYKTYHAAAKVESDSVIIISSKQAVSVQPVERLSH